MTEKNAIIITQDENIFIQYYGRRKYLTKPRKVSLIKDEELLKFSDNVNLLLDQGFPVYITDFSLYNYDKNGKRDDSVQMLKHIPSPEEFEGVNKTLVICDDLELKEISKEQRRALDRLFGFVSTHKNISVCLCSQDPFNVPPIVRRCSNVFVLWRLVDMDSMAMTTRKTGLESGTLKRIFNKLMTEPRDSLWIDLTDKSPAKLRKNGYEIIERTKKRSI